MKLKTSIFTDYFSNKNFDKLSDAYKLIQEENLLLRKNGIQQAKDFGAEIELLTQQINDLKSSTQADIKAKTLDLDRANQQLEANKSRLKEAEEESELLLLQLHQVQEELESVFLKEQEAQQQTQEFQKKVQEAHKELQDQLKLSKEQQAQLEVASKEKQTFISSRDEQAKLLQQSQKELEASRQENSKLVSDRDAQIRLAEERQAQLQSVNEAIDKLKKENAELAKQVERANTEVLAQFKEAQDENELLLLQLHQVQEELEHYFLEFQRLQRENEGYASRWQRLEDRQPDYLDFEAIMPVKVDAISATPHIEWVVKDVLVGGVAFPEFKFMTFLEDGQPGIELLTDESQPEAHPVRLVPRALLKPQALEAIAAFRNMSALDWRQIKVAVGCVEHFFKDPKRASVSQSLPENFDFVFWRQISSPLIADIKAVPAVFRFNQIKLKRELIHPDYEHLWLEIADATYGDMHWPKFELRIGAANIQPGGFSRFPKIEFPRIDGKVRPFASWFEESFDDFGGKLEIRFDLNKQLFDLGVWLKLSQQDQMMLLSLVGSLPLVLKALERDKTAIARPWDSWSGLISGLINVIRKRLSEAGEVLKKESAKKMVETDQSGITDKKSVKVEETTSASVAADIKTDVKASEGASAEKDTSRTVHSKKSSRHVSARHKKTRRR